MKLGSRLPGVDERDDTAIGSMMLGTIGGHSKIGMPVVELHRGPLVTSGFQVNAAGGQDVYYWPSENAAVIDWNGPVISGLGVTVEAVVLDIGTRHLPTFGTPGTFDVTAHLELVRTGPDTATITLFILDATLSTIKATQQSGPHDLDVVEETLTISGYEAAAGDVVVVQVLTLDPVTPTASWEVGPGSFVRVA